MNDNFIETNKDDSGKKEKCKEDETFAEKLLCNLKESFRFKHWSYACGIMNYIGKVNSN